MSEKNYRIDSLDALRGVAVLAIVLYHFLFLKIPVDASLGWQLLAKPLSLCWIGVDLFFVLSGFLIGDIVMAHGRAKNFFSVFWIRRFCRIVPVYVIFLGAFLVIRHFWHIPSPYYGAMPAKPVWSYLAMVQNWFMAVDGDAGNYILGVTWTLAVECQFYLLIPFVLVRVPDRRVPLLCAGMILAAFGLRLWVLMTGVLPLLSTFIFFPFRIDAFAAGILAAWIYRRCPEWRDAAPAARRAFAGIFAVLLAGVLSMFYFEPRFSGHTSASSVYLYSLLALFFGCVVLISLWARGVDRFRILSNPALVGLGWISYSFYLFHTLVNCVAHYGLMRRNDGVLSLSDLTVTALAFSVTILLSMALRETVEKPFIALGKKLKFDANS